MKPFRIYDERVFPRLSLTNPVVVTKEQGSWHFEEREVPQTTVRYISKDPITGLARYIIQSGVWRDTTGYIRNPLGREPRTIPIDGFVQEVEFDLFHHVERKIAVFQAPKKVCRGVVENLKGKLDIELNELQVDIDKVCQMNPLLKSVTFRKISEYVNSATLHGDQLHHDFTYKNLAKLAEKSNVVIKWKFKNDEHPVMVTESGILVLVNDYSRTPNLELQLVLDLYDNILKNALCSSKPDFDDPLDPTNLIIVKSPSKKSNNANTQKGIDKPKFDDSEGFSLKGNS